MSVTNPTGDWLPCPYCSDETNKIYHTGPCPKAPHWNPVEFKPLSTAESDVLNYLHRIEQLLKRILEK